MRVFSCKNNLLKRERLFVENDLVIAYLRLFGHLYAAPIVGLQQQQQVITILAQPVDQRLLQLSVVVLDLQTPAWLLDKDPLGVALYAYVSTSFLYKQKNICNSLIDYEIAF